MGTGVGVSLQGSDAADKNKLQGTGHFVAAGGGPTPVGPQGAYAWTEPDGRRVNIGEVGVGAGSPDVQVGGSYTYVSGYIFEWCGWRICNIGNSKL
jgi:hypothetical protein